MRSTRDVPEMYMTCTYRSCTYETYVTCTGDTPYLIFHIGVTPTVLHQVGQSSEMSVVSGKMNWSPSQLDHITDKVDQHTAPHTQQVNTQLHTHNRSTHSSTHTTGQHTAPHTQQVNTQLHTHNRSTHSSTHTTGQHTAPHTNLVSCELESIRGSFMDTPQFITVTTLSRQ